jgi:hypothetical protein
MRTCIIALFVGILLIVSCPVHAQTLKTPFSAVTIANTPSNPVPVTGTINNTAINPVQVTGKVQCEKATTPVRIRKDFVAPLGSSVWEGTLYTVPTGKRLVVEYVSCSVFVDAIPSYVNCQIMERDAPYAIFHLPTVSVDTGQARSVHSVQSMRVIFESGQILDAFAQWGAASSIVYLNVFGLAGYLEDAP